MEDLHELAELDPENSELQEVVEDGGAVAMLDLMGVVSTKKAPLKTEEAVTTMEAVAMKKAVTTKKVPLRTEDETPRMDCDELTETETQPPPTDVAQMKISLPKQRKNANSRWLCKVEGCETQARTDRADMCKLHYRLFVDAGRDTAANKEATKEVESEINTPMIGGLSSLPCEPGQLVSQMTAQDSRTCSSKRAAETTPKLAHVPNNRPSPNSVTNSATSMPGSASSTASTVGGAAADIDDLATAVYLTSMRYQEPPPKKDQTQTKPKRIRKRCSAPNCSNRTVQGGVCVKHGAKRKTCSHPDCTKAVKIAGLCSSHGPSRRRCDTEGCHRVAVQGGKCLTHGARRRLCCYNIGEGKCKKHPAVAGMCKKHYEATVQMQQTMNDPQMSSSASVSPSKPEKKNKKEDEAPLVHDGQQSLGSYPGLGAGGMMGPPVGPPVQMMDPMFMNQTFGQMDPMFMNQMQMNRMMMMGGMGPMSWPRGMLDSDEEMMLRASR